MPFIDSKITVPVSEEQKEKIKSELGKAISLLHKPESYLMVGIADKYDLWFAGKKLDKGAYVSVDVLGDVSADDSNKMSGAVCDILKKELDIPGDKIYVEYRGTRNWGWNGSNF
jgi:phenylpyruvate tautomerase PptA (4-oxalocrotonate tautomerase family)